jgi:hypothetical protein
VTRALQSVRVHVTSGRWLGRSGGDCADGVVVALKEPPGTRSVVDQSTGTVVEVFPADEDLLPPAVRRELRPLQSLRQMGTDLPLEGPDGPSVM